MKIATKYYKSFNHPDTLLYVSSFPEQFGELAKENAVAWYSHQLLSHFPKQQKVVVLAESRNANDTAWLLRDNILVVPTYSTSVARFTADVFTSLKKWNKPSQVLIQYELNSFGHKLNTMAMPFIIGLTKSIGKRVALALHQVITDFSSMAGHIGLKPNSLGSKALTFTLRRWYQTVGVLADHVIVFDQELKERLSNYANPEKIVVIPMGMAKHNSLHSSKATARKSYSIPSNATVVLAFGYQSWYKGTDWIVDQVGILNKQNPDKPVHLLLAGSVSPTVDNKQFSKNLRSSLKKYREFVTDVGYVQESELATCFSAADIVVYPYRAMMSASGALSQALRFKKPFLLSEHLLPTLKSTDFAHAMLQSGLSKEDIFFQMNKSTLSTAVSRLQTKGMQRKIAQFIEIIGNDRQWSEVAKSYVSALTKNNQFTTKSGKSNKKSKLRELSVFFPLYNEEENVAKLVAHSLAVLPRIAHKFELILVNDGSTDKTKAIAEKLAKKHSGIRVITQKNGGYGKALRTGFESARYDWVFFSDGDLQFDLQELELFLPHTAHHDVVIGYRKNRADTWNRLLLASMLKLWNRFFFSFPSHVKDIDCAFKLFNRKTLYSLFPLESWGAMISTEMILKIIDEGFELKQIGVTHYPRQFGSPTGAKPHVIMGAVKETFAILQKRYARKSNVRWWQSARYQVTALLLSIAQALISAVLAPKA